MLNIRDYVIKLLYKDSFIASNLFKVRRFYLRNEN